MSHRKQGVICREKNIGRLNRMRSNRVSTASEGFFCVRVSWYRPLYELCSTLKNRHLFPYEIWITYDSEGKHGEGSLLRLDTL